MNKQQALAKKRKNREKVAKEKILSRRNALRLERKKRNQEKAAEYEANMIVHGKPKPIINDPEKMAEWEARQTKYVSEKLKKNLEILKALEQEYDQEQARRAEMNQKLESEGHKTMREKMDALHQKALALTGKGELLAKATEEYAAQPTEEMTKVEESEKMD